MPDYPFSRNLDYFLQEQKFNSDVAVQTVFKDLIDPRLQILFLAIVLMNYQKTEELCLLKL